MSTLSGKLKTTIVAAAMAVTGSVAAQGEEFVLSSGSQGGSWYPLAGAIKAIAEQMDPKLSITVTPGAGVANVVGVSIGKFPSAFANTISTVDALAGRLRELAPLEGFDMASYAGGIEGEREVEFRDHGIPVGPVHRDDLEGVAAEFGVDVPW